MRICVRACASLSRSDSVLQQLQSRTSASSSLHNKMSGLGVSSCAMTATKCIVVAAAVASVASLIVLPRAHAEYSGQRDVYIDVIKQQHQQRHKCHVYAISMIC